MYLKACVGFFFILVAPAFLYAGDYDASRPAATVEKLRGSITLNGKAIQENETIFDSGTLVSGAKSFVKIYVDHWGSEISLGPNSQMELKLDGKLNEPNKYILKGGVCRWVTKFWRSKAHEGEPVRTKTASMGVRGTDFKVIYRPKGETEIIVFEGEVLFKSNLAKSEALVKTGQWGGVGGKFGKKVSKLVTLNAKDLEKMKQDIE